MNNNKTYTEAVLEFADKLNIVNKEFINKIDIVEQRIINRLDAIVINNAECKESLARSEIKFVALDDKLDGKGGMNERIDANKSDIKTNEEKIIQIRNLNTVISGIGATIASIIGLQK